MIKGYLVLLNGNCKNDLEGIYMVFIPTRNEKKALDYVGGNGYIISVIEYEVNFDILSEPDKITISERIEELK